VLSVACFGDDDKAAALVNDTKYEVAAYVLTQDIDRVLRLVSALDAGNIGVNRADARPGWAVPSGGAKDSSYGKVSGREGLMEYVRTNNALIALR
jgi:acyl-CoA reductase-like NAD-dependent aldehyde dehydrogenase